MRNEHRQKYLSNPRFNRYLLATRGDNTRAKRLYKANIRLSQSFHPLITQFEVVLRNAIDGQLSHYFTDPDWIINQKAGFMNHYTLRRSHYFLKTSVLKSETTLGRRGISITSGKIISDQAFGFWTSLFLPHHFALIGGQPIQIFAHKPAAINRSQIYSRLDTIRNFRNRINHSEPICFHGSVIDCSEASDIRNKLYELLNWVEPGLTQFFNSIDNVSSTISKVTRI